MKSSDFCIQCIYCPSRRHSCKKICFIGKSPAVQQSSWLMGMCLWQFIHSANIYWLLLYAGPVCGRRRGLKSGWSTVNKNLLGVSSSGHKKKCETAQLLSPHPGEIRYLELSADDFYWLLIIPNNFHWWKANGHNYQCLYSGGSFIVARDGCASHVRGSWQTCQGRLHQGLRWVWHGVAFPLTDWIGMWGFLDITLGETWSAKC